MGILILAGGFFRLYTVLFKYVRNLSKADRDFVFELIDKLKEYEIKESV